MNRQLRIGQPRKTKLAMVAMVVMAVVASCAASSAMFAQETAVATKGNLEMTVNIPGIFIADDKSVIKMEPGKYTGELIVTKILDEGVDIREGDVLIEFDTDNVDQAIEEAQNELTDATVELKKATAEFETAVLDKDAQAMQLKRELEFLERDVRAAIARQNLDIEEKKKEIADSEHRLQQTRVDFNTLEEVYKERNIVGSVTGNILFDRERVKIENGEKGLDVLKKQLAYFEQFDQSKTQLEKELEVEKKLAEIKKQAVTLEAAIVEKKGVVDKAKRKSVAATRKVEGLEQDREQLKVVSPRDGILFYGETGQEMPAGIVIMGGLPNIRKELRIGGRVQTHKVLLTVAKMEQLSIKMSISEEDIQHLKVELDVTIFPDAFPKRQFSGKLNQVDEIATKVGFSSNERRFKVMAKCTEDAPLLRSGMNCRVAIHADAVQDVVLVPVTSVFADGDNLVCYVKNGSDVATRTVRIGHSNADQVEIVEGIKSGETVMLSRAEKD